MKNILMILMLTFVGLSAQAQDARDTTGLNGAKKSKNAKYSIEVNGNCEQCKKRIEKAAYSVIGVKSAVWDVETHQLALIVNEEKTSLPDIKKAIANVGHDTDDVKSTQETYDHLHSCCKYDRKE